MTDGSRAIDRSSDRPAYKQLADIIRDQVRSGELRAGANLPSEAELVARYGIGKQTVKAALMILKADGLLLSERGRHWTVRPTVFNQARRYTEGKDNYAGDTDSRFAAEHGVPWGQYDLERVYTTIPATARIAAALGIAEGTPVVERQWIHAIDGVVIRLALSYLEEARFGHTIMCDMDEPPWPGGTIAQLKHLGYDVTQVHGETRIHRVTIPESHILNVDPGTAAMETWRAQLVNGRAMEVARHLHPERSGHVLVWDQQVGEPIEPWRQWAGRSYD